MLTREEVKSAIHFGNPPRPPRAFTKWWGEGLHDQYGAQLSRFNKYEEDVVVLGFPVPSFGYHEDGFYWRLPQVKREGKVGHDANCVLPDWKK